MAATLTPDLATLPDRLFAPDMARIFRVSLARFYKLDARGEFLWAEMRPRIGRKAWSKGRVVAYFAGDLHGLTEKHRLHRVG
jgi:hypothetical protein